MGVNAVGRVHGVSNNAKSFAGPQTLESDSSRRRKHTASVIRFCVRSVKQKEIPISNRKVVLDTILTTFCHENIRLLLHVSNGFLLK